MEDAKAQLFTALRSGSDLNTACHFAGLSIALVYKWLERGKTEAERLESGEVPRETEDEYLEFWNELKKARADAVMRNVAHVQKAAQAGEWRAAQWWLEKSVPEVYGSKTPRAVDGASQKAIEQG